MESIVRYTARDGTEVELSAQDVVDYVTGGAVKPSEKDVAMLLATFKARGLNPLAGDCFVTVYKNKRTGETSARITVSRDYWQRVAVTFPTYKGMQAGIAVANNGQFCYRVGSMLIPGETLLGGWCEVHDTRWDVPVRQEVSLQEYDQGNDMWAEKPATMIRKVAIAQTLREAYPSAYAGVYGAEELGTEGVPTDIEEAEYETA